MTERETMTNPTHTSLDEAIAAARSGRRADATQLLRQIVADDPFNADAWLWLGGLATEPREQRSALEHALTITPQNQRAQQGLAWLRQNHPDAFRDPVAPATGATMAMPATPATHEHTAEVYDAPTQAMPAGGTVYDAPTRPNAAVGGTVYDAPTRAMPAAPAPLFQTDRLPVQSAAAAPGVSRTDRMAVAPAPPQVQDEVVVRRSPFANFARILILLLNLPSFGAAATLAALTLWNRDGFVQVANNQLAALGSQLAPAAVETTYWSTVATLVVVAVLDLFIILGFAFRVRLAWWVNLLIATLALAGSIALLVPDFTFTAAQIGPLTINNGIVQVLGGITAFTAIFWLLSLASRRAFYPRRIVQHGR